MSSDHPAVVVDDSVEVVDGRLLDVFFMTDAELTEVKVSDVNRKVGGVIFVL